MAGLGSLEAAASLGAALLAGASLSGEPPDVPPDVEREIVRTAVQQLRMIVVGAQNWRSR